MKSDGREKVVGKETKARDGARSSNRPGFGPVHGGMSD